MNKMTRAFVMTGVAAAAGLTISAGPAAASPAGSSAAADFKPKHTATQQSAFPRRDRIVGFYNSPRTCHRIGKTGVWQDRWERYTCFRVYRGFHRGDWALKVSYGWNSNHHDRDWNGGPDNHHWNNGPGDRDQGPRGPWKNN
ncbi:hypothetical protein [Actinoplanes sp. NPDC049802]|uniref:hypothetical protein n=1 Tax=Actinoplanes sp. NPDC049802 TaxID=3154742 RepID=UPI0033E8C240